MPYNKTTWQDGITTVDANKMNNIENGIYNNDKKNTEILNRVVSLETELSVVYEEVSG